MGFAKVWHKIVIVAMLFASTQLVGCASPPTAGNEILPTKPETATSLLTENPLPSPYQEPTPTHQYTETPLPPPDPIATSMVGTQKVTREGIMLVYKRSGGYAGVDEEYTIHLNGLISTKDEREIWADPDEVDLLLQELEKLGVFEMNPEYLSKDTCCDRFLYELSVYSEDQAVTVRTIDFATNAPDQLWAALKLVQNFLDQVFDG